ncbi:MAG: glycosyltransferase family 4 protein [Aerococcus sp.]|nr:glycosyltransferase family 4 protein [Aerococcus sp.]
MKVLHVCSYFSTSPLFKQLFDRQIAKNVDIDVYVPIAHEYPEERIASSGAYTTTIRTHHQNDRFFFHYKHYKILKDILTRYDMPSYDLIHAHSLFSNGWIAYQLHQRFGTPYIVAVRSADIETFFKKAKWLWHMGIEILAHAEKIIFIAENHYNDVFTKYIPRRRRQAFKAKSEIIYNGVDDFWHDHRYTDKVAELHKPLQIVATGKLIGVKHLDTLAKNIETLNSYYPTQLNIIGQDWDKNLLEKLTSYPFVNYLGTKNKAEMTEIYRQMDIFALLSFPETFGLVYVEAMSQGLPVMYTKNEGFDSFFPNYTVGAGVRRNNQQDFFAGIKQITENYPSFIANALRGSEQFKWDDIVARYLKIYQNIVG